MSEGLVSVCHACIWVWWWIQERASFYDPLPSEASTVAYEVILMSSPPTQPGSPEPLWESFLETYLFRVINIPSPLKFWRENCHQLKMKNCRRILLHRSSLVKITVKKNPTLAMYAITKQFLGNLPPGKHLEGKKILYP